MSKLKRYFSPGQVYFVTSVTDNHNKILIENQDLFWYAIDKVKSDAQFELTAWVLMPDHFHLIIDPQNSDLSSLMKRIKLTFAYQFRQRQNLYRGKVWQSRYWDHVIRNESDLKKHLDYIHYNPVRHGLASRPSDWEQSSFRIFLNAGQYEPDWGVSEFSGLEGDFGE